MDFTSLLGQRDRREDGSAEPYDPGAQEAMLKGLFGPSAPQYFWIFPPFFLIPAMLLAGMPYLSALVLWQGTTLVADLQAMRQAFKCRFAIPLALASPAVGVNLAHGQTGFLTAALFTAGLSVVGSRPFLAGMALGGLAFKPQLCVLLLVAILAG